MYDVDPLPSSLEFVRDVEKTEEYLYEQICEQCQK